MHQLSAHIRCTFEHLRLFLHKISYFYTSHSIGHPAIVPPHDVLHVLVQVNDPQPAFVQTLDHQQAPVQPHDPQPALVMALEHQDIGNVGYQFNNCV